MSHVLYWYQHIFFSITYTSDVFHYGYHAFPFAGREGSGLKASSLEHRIFVQSQEIQQPFHSWLSQISPKQDNHLHKPCSSKLNSSIPVRLCIYFLSPLILHSGSSGGWGLFQAKGGLHPGRATSLSQGRRTQAAAPTGDLESLLCVTSTSRGEHAKWSWSQTLNHRSVLDCIYISISSASSMCVLFSF